LSLVFTSLLLSPELSRDYPYCCRDTFHSHPATLLKEPYCAPRPDLRTAHIQRAHRYPSWHLKDFIGGPAEVTPSPTEKLLVALPTDDEQEATTTAAEKTKGQCPEREVVAVKRLQELGRHVLSLRLPCWI
jgi:hypothetical protein